jgi:hypothetical protein
MVALAWWLYLSTAAAEAGRPGGPATGWTLVGGAFAAIAAIVVWPPSLAIGLVVQVVATVALAAGVGMLYQSTAR